MKSPAGFAKAPPKPAEVRRQGRNIRARQDAERDAAASDFYSQLGGDGKEANRLRMRERVNPGYTETRARQLPEDRETYYRQRTLANQRRLTRSQDFYRQPEPQPSEPAPTVVADTPAQEPVTGRVKSGNSADSGSSFSGGDAQAKRRRVAPQKLTRALAGGDLSRLLGA